MKIYKEYDRKYVANPIKFPWAVESSKLREASLEEIHEARLKFLKTKECDHSFVIDTDAYLYDFRTCAICDQGLGAV
jgi:hypothetical protein